MLSDQGYLLSAMALFCAWAAGIPHSHYLEGDTMSNFDVDQFLEKVRQLPKDQLLILLSVLERFIELEAEEAEGSTS